MPLPGQPKWVTDTMRKEAARIQEEILDRVEMFQQDITQEAELELARQFKLSDKKARTLLEEWS